MASQNYRNTVQEWDEKLEQCPYYPSHQIRPARFGHHLIQCRKALSKQPTSPYYHKIDDLVVCKFNSHHHIPRERMGDHNKKCQGIVTVLKNPMNRGPELFNKADDGISNIMTGVERINTHADDDDDWDDDYTPAYDPSAKAAQLPMHLPAGLTPAERRNYRINKRHDVYEDFEGSELPVGASGQNQSPVQSSWAEPPRASYPPPSPKMEPSRTSYYPPSPKVEPPRASYSPPSQKRTDTNDEPNESWANAAGKRKNKKKKKPKVLEAKENNNDDDDWEVLPASYKKDEDWDQVPVSNKKGGQNPGKNNVSRGGSDRGAPPGFGNKFAGLSAEVPKKGGRNRGEDDEVSTVRKRNLPEVASNGLNQALVSNNLAQEDLKNDIKQPALDAKSATQQDAKNAIHQEASGVTRSLPKSTVTTSKSKKVWNEEEEKSKDLIEYSSHWLIWPIFVIAIIMILYGWNKIYQLMKRY